MFIDICIRSFCPRYLPFRSVNFFEFLHTLCSVPSGIELINFRSKSDCREGCYGLSVLFRHVSCLSRTLDPIPNSKISEASSSLPPPNDVIFGKISVGLGKIPSSALLYRLWWDLEKFRDLEWEIWRNMHCIQFVQILAWFLGLVEKIKFSFGPRVWGYRPKCLSLGKLKRT